MDNRRIINHIVKPWVQLNFGLAQPLALQPEQSDFIQKAESLSVFISHFPESVGLARADYDKKSKPNSVITDVADSSKHINLSNPKRQSKLFITADFEFKISDTGITSFKFIRNFININHATHGEIDFMEYSKDAIDYILRINSISVTPFGPVLESQGVYEDTVKIDYDPSYGANMNQVVFRFKTLNKSGDLVVQDPPNGFSFSMRDLSKIKQ
ncbi:MAG: hypothetical protein COB43_06155 [Oceanospirillales bacterium]|nr:MAG: hypothetical protein COB43_06155 [Oceanospirillales bacterium]